MAPNCRSSYRVLPLNLWLHAVGGRWQLFRVASLTMLTDWSCDRVVGVAHQAASTTTVENASTRRWSKHVLVSSVQTLKAEGPRACGAPLVLRFRNLAAS